MGQNPQLEAGYSRLPSMRADVNGRENSCLSGEAIAVGGRLTLPAVRWKKRHRLSQVVFCTHQHRNKPSDLQTHWSSISCPDGVYPTGLECAECLLMFWDVSLHFRSMSAGWDFCTKTPGSMNTCNNNQGVGDKVWAATAEGDPWSVVPAPMINWIFNLWLKAPSSPLR